MTFTADLFDRVSDLAEAFTGRAWDGTTEHLAQTMDLQDGYLSALGAHAAWLTAIRTRAEAEGRDWTQSELLRQSRRVDGLATPRDDQVDWEGATRR